MTDNNERKTNERGRSVNTLALGCIGLIILLAVTLEVVLTFIFNL